MGRKTTKKRTIHDEIDTAGGVRCPHCGKEMIAKALRKSSDNDSDKVLKTRLVFFTDNQTIRGVCGGCKRTINMPYKIVPE